MAAQQYQVTASTQCVIQSVLDKLRIYLLKDIDVLLNVLYWLSVYYIAMTGEVFQQAKRLSEVQGED